MSINYWHRQTKNTPLFPELEWSRPENKRYAGKLLIIGGNKYGFAAPATAFSNAEQAGIGSTRVLLPDVIRKTVGAFMPEAEFAPTNLSGSFASESLSGFLDNASWSDATILAGDLGRNSETAIVLEKFVTTYTGSLTVTKDAVDYFVDSPSMILNRSSTLIVLSFAQLQKLLIKYKFPKAVTFNMDLIHLVSALHELTSTIKAFIIVKHHNVIIVAGDGRVSTTKVESDTDVWRVNTAAQATVWWLQHPQKPFEALTSSAIS